MAAYWSMLRKNAVAYLFLLPACVSILFVDFVPMIYGVRLSFYVKNIFRPDYQPFVGLQQYRQLIEDPLFIRSFLQGWYWTIGSVIGSFVVGMVAAIVMNQRLPARGLIRGIILIPWVVPSALAAMMFALLLTSVGLVNTVLTNLGVIHDWHPWLSDPRTAMPALILTNTWKGFPFFAVMLLAGMQAIPVELYEASRIDGATAWQTFWYVTLPSLRSTIMISTLLSTIWTFSSIDLIYIMTSGGPFYATFTLAMFAYVTAFGTGQMGYAAAASVVVALILMIFTAIYLYAYLRHSDD
ncbi:MAG TPA: sugar ABC transporter permease [Chloroflexota bacterium]|nr:sugar ABC transporter permease [Chloroflexota bacterium]